MRAFSGWRGVVGLQSVGWVGVVGWWLALGELPENAVAGCPHETIEEPPEILLRR